MIFTIAFSTCTTLSESQQSCDVVIDPGHGGFDRGAVADKINEKDITLQISESINNLLNENGIKAQLTRNKDKFVSLDERVAFAGNQNARVIVSIHINNSSNPADNSLLTISQNNEQSVRFSECLENELVKTKLFDHCDRQTSDKYKVLGSEITTVIINLGYLSNIEDQEHLTDTYQQHIIAGAISNGIRNFLNQQ